LKTAGCERAMAERFETPVRYTTPGSPIIRMKGIEKTFETAAGQATVLKGIDVDIHQGEFVGIVGRSGSGKSTLVNMITGIDRPSAGAVEVGGQPVHQMPESRMAVWRGRNLGIVFQFFQLLPMLTLVENVMLPMDFCNIYPPAERQDRAMALLRRVGLEGLAHKLPGAVAGGQQQSAAVARALANDPPILIADEPTGNLDTQTAEQVMHIFEELLTQGKTILLVTHDRSLVRRTHRTLLISDGELVNEALTAAFPDAPHTPLLALSKRAAPVQLAPGAPLPRAEERPDVVYLLTQGDLLLNNGETVQLTGSSLIDPLSVDCDVRAGRQGAALLALPQDGLLPLLANTARPAPFPCQRAAQPAPRPGLFRRRRSE